MATNAKLLWPIVILSFLNGVFSSVGDTSSIYNLCVQDCVVKICDEGKGSSFSYNFFGFGLSLWSCWEHCEYDCQWKTVESFQKKKWPIPQFKGKWPFIRLFGFQEPASVIFSLLNFLAVSKSLIKFREKVSKSSPYYYMWNIMALVQLNSWIWSIIYHSRDNDFTERMDYISAFVVVLYSLYCAGLRCLSSAFNMKTFLWSAFCASFGLNHLAYLWLYNFDYGYNMKLNVAIGGSCVVLWFFWSFLHFNKQPYVWKIFLFAFLIALTSAFELLDFPPILWLFDAHSLWHGSTVFVNCVLYWFIIDDCNYLNNIKLELQHINLKKK